MMFIELNILVLLVIVFLVVFAGIGGCVWLLGYNFTVTRSDKTGEFKLEGRYTSVFFNHATIGNKCLILHGIKRNIVGIVPAAGRDMDEMLLILMDAGVVVR